MKKIISLLLIVTLLFTTLCFTAGAESKEEFISDVALVYEDSVEKAREAIAGTDWKLFEQDLNPNADYMFDDGVYLIYKTSTNVEDAITDLRVMDMYGGFSVSDYKTQLEQSRKGYKEMVKDLRIIAGEFKALYEANNEMALLAYRQMNYYKDMATVGGTETNMLMGDFFLNMPTDDNAIIQVFMEGNSLITYNLLKLLAIGISGSGNTSLSEKIAEKYAIKDTLTHEEYYNDAEALYDALYLIRGKLLRYDALSEEHDMSDESIPESEINFINECAALALLLEKINIGDTTLAGLIRKGEYTIEDLYPIVAAFTEGQQLLVDIGQLETVLKYNTPTKPVEDLNATLDETEKEMKDENGNIKPINVYLGVDRTIFKGAFAMTSEAERQQAITGDTWDLGSAAVDSLPFYIASSVLGVVDVALIGAAIGIKVKASSLATAAAVAAESYEAAVLSGGFTTISSVEEASYASAVFAKKYLPMVKPIAVAAVAVALVVVGLVSISTWYNYYNPDYAVIPDTMIDVCETDAGDKYVKYTAAKVYGDDGKKNADFNAYEGKEWIALYYTKDATAGNPLIPKFVYKDNDSTVARRHQGISMFGESDAFNLNTHTYSKNAPGVYVTVRYSTTKKAATEIPPVVGSVFATGVLYTVTAVGGAGLGVGATLLIQRIKKKKKDENSPESSEEE